MLQKIKEKGHYQAFFITLALAAVVFLPFIIYDKGIFFFYGDFNVQQIPFYKLAHEAIRSGTSPGTGTPIWGPTSSAPIAFTCCSALFSG